jgi:hypothetical protein
MTPIKGKRRTSSRGTRWNAAYGLEVVEEWTRSGLSAVEFCRSRGIALQRLSYWRQRSKPATPPSVESPAADAAAFFTLSVGEPPTRAGLTTGTRADGIEVRIGERVVVSLDVALGRERFVQSVRWILEALGA